MHEPPGPADLLATARKVLVEELLPFMPPEQKFAALMVANAMAIVCRQVEAALDPGIAPPRVSNGGVPDEATPADVLKALCSNIRAGDYDPGRPDRELIRSYLKSFAASRCAVSNPKTLVSR